MYERFYGFREAPFELTSNPRFLFFTAQHREALANLVQPFFMLPILGLFHLRARDVMGYTIVVFLALTPVVLVLVTLLGMTLSYPL